MRIANAREDHHIMFIGIRRGFQMFFGPELLSNHGHEQITPDASGKVLRRSAQSRIKHI